MKHTYSEYSVLFTHATQSAYRISRNLWTFLLSLPQHSRHSWYTSSKISIVQGHTGITLAFIHSHQSSLFVCTFWSLALPLNQSSSTAISGLHALNQLVPAHFLLIPFYFLFISFSFWISLIFYFFYSHFMFLIFVFLLLSFMFLFPNIFEYLYTHVLVVSQ